MNNWAVFADIDTFDAWHTSVKEKYNYPLIGNNQETGELDLVNITKDYTEPYISDSDPRIIAWVGDETEGLSIIDKNDSIWSDWYSEIVRRTLYPHLYLD